MDEYTRFIMNTTEEEEEFLDGYRRMPEEIQVLLQKFIMGNEEEQAEAEKVINQILDEARRDGRLK